MSAPETSQVDQEDSSGRQESIQPGAGAGAGAGPVRMQQGNMWRNMTALCGLSTGSLDPDPEGSGSLQAAQEPPSPGDPQLAHEECTPDLSLPPHSPLGPTGSPHRQCSLEASSTATPIPTPHGLSSSPRSEQRASPLSHPHGLSSFPNELRPPSQPQLAKVGEGEGSHPPTTSELYKAQLLETDSESASSTYLTCSSAEEGEDDPPTLDNLEETGEENLSDMQKQLRDLGLNPCSYTLSDQLLQEQLFQDLVIFIDSPRALLVREMQSGTRPSFHRAHEVLRCIHSTVEHVCSDPARHSLRSLLRVLAERFPEDTARSLLRISPHCDSAAVAMWEAMLSPLSKKQNIIEGLLRVIQGSAPEEHVSAASRVLRRLCQSPRCQESLKLYHCADFLMALLDHLARAAQTLLDEQPEDDQPSPLGEAVEAIKDLLCVAGCRENVQQVQEEGGWDMMLQGETLEAGVSLLAREMCRSPGFVRLILFTLVKFTLSCRREEENAFAMAFYVELLGCQDIAKQPGDLRLLRYYLDCGSDRMLLLAVRGLVAVAQDPEMAAKMQDRVVLDCILGRLQHKSEDLRVEALLLLRKLTAHPTGDEEAIHITVMLAEKLPLLFDDESSQVRELSIELFGETMGTLVSRKERWMQIIIQGNLLSLLLRMNDETESVAQASAKALLICAKILGWRKLKREVKRKRTMRIAEILVERDRDVKYHVHACLPYLRDAQSDVRLAAVKFMGAAARHLSKDSDMEELQGMCDALQSLENDPEPRVRSLAAETLQNLGTEQHQQRSRWSLRSLFCCCC